MVVDLMFEKLFALLRYKELINGKWKLAISNRQWTMGNWQ
jgi:hypothetical protein